MTGEFDRITPPGAKPPRGGGTTPADDAAEAHGRAALFSAEAPKPSGPDGLQLRCSACGEPTPLTVHTALRAALPLALIAPWRRDPVFARCRECRRRTWQRVEAAE